MAKRRMFSKEVIQTEWFTDMPATTQMLYVHLSLQADDDGFVTGTKVPMLFAHASKDDLSILIAKNYVIEVENGLYLLKHWGQNNQIQKDRYKPSSYRDRLINFDVKADGSYTEKKPMDTECIQDGYNLDTQYRLGKESIGKSSVGKERKGLLGEGEPSEEADSTDHQDNNEGEEDFPW